MLPVIRIFNIATGYTYVLTVNLIFINITASIFVLLTSKLKNNLRQITVHGWLEQVIKLSGFHNPCLLIGKRESIII